MVTVTTMAMAVGHPQCAVGERLRQDAGERDEPGDLRQHRQVGGDGERCALVDAGYLRGSLRGNEPALKYYIYADGSRLSRERRRSGASAGEQSPLDDGHRRARHLAESRKPAAANSRLPRGYGPERKGRPPGGLRISDALAPSTRNLDREVTRYFGGRGVNDFGQERPLPRESRAAVSARLRSETPEGWRNACKDGR